MTRFDDCLVKSHFQQRKLIFTNAVNWFYMTVVLLVEVCILALQCCRGSADDDLNAFGLVKDVSMTTLTYTYTMSKITHPSTYYTTSTTNM